MIALDCPPAAVEAPAAMRVLGPETGAFVAAGVTLAGWALRASPGECCVYARAVTLPRTADGAVRARAFSAAGLLRLNVRRTPFDLDPGSRPGANSPAPGARTLFDYLARRTATPFDGAQGSRRASPIPDDLLNPDERLLLDGLAKLADAHLPCPPNAELALMVGLSSPKRVGAVMMKLREAGAIEVEWLADPLRPMAGAIVRMVTIVASGARTRVLHGGRSGAVGL